MSDVLAGLEPAHVWARFGELTRIARPPRGEQAVREHVLRWAAQHGFETGVDEAGNAVVRVPASPGREGAPAVVLQAHLDMVCERDPESPYDAREGRIHVVRQDDWLLAEGTTLGADDGIGVAAALAVAEDPESRHGRLELLFTVCEEEGLVGAKELDPDLVSGRLLVNLDGTSDGAITVGCAGSAHTFVRQHLSRRPVAKGDVGLLVRLSGGRGGHSGGDIALGRANAIGALGNVLTAAYERAPFLLARLDGGVSRNAIPREAEAVASLPVGGVDDFRKTTTMELEHLRARHADAGDALVLGIEPADAGDVWDDESTRTALGLLRAIPGGVLAMSTEVPGAIETSTSLNVARTKGDTLTLASMTRSALEAGLEDTVADIERIASAFGADVDVRRSYPPWRPDLGSGLLAAARGTYRRTFGAEPRLEVVHGGLECAVIGDKLPGAQMIALGPRIESPHAPGERVSISGTQRFYRLLGDLLDELSR